VKKCDVPEQKNFSSRGTASEIGVVYSRRQ